MSDYEALKAAGHSPAKAAEIVLDAQRGDSYAVGWMSITKSNMVTGPSEPVALYDADGEFSRYA